VGMGGAVMGRGGLDEVRWFRVGVDIVCVFVFIILAPIFSYKTERHCLATFWLGNGSFQLN
jgi:hypothetical protein